MKNIFLISLHKTKVRLLVLFLMIFSIISSWSIGIARADFSDQFSTPLAPGAVNGTNAEPGPGSRFVTDSENKLYISSGRLYFSGGKAVPAWGDPGLWYPSEAFSPGKIFSFEVSPGETNKIIAGGFDSNTSGAIKNSIVFNSNGAINIFDDGLTVPGGGAYQAISYNAAIVEREGGGFFVLLKPATSSRWELFWVSKSASLTSAYPSVLSYSGSTNMDNLDLRQLDSPWDSRYGIAEYYSENPTSGEVITAEKDGLMEFTWTPQSAEVLDFSFRMVDENNRWVIRCDQANSSISLIEIENGSEVQINSKANTWNIGTQYRIVAKLLEQKIVFWAGENVNTYINSYLYADFNQKATDISVSGFTSGSNLIFWPKEVTSPIVTETNYRSFLGWGDSKTDGDNYQTPLLEKLNADGYNDWIQSPSEMGRGGWTVDMWTDQIDADLSSSIGVPNYILINIGANDIGQLNPEIDPSEWKTNFAYILDAMHDKWPDAKVLVMRIWRIYNNGQMDDLNDDWIPEVLSPRSSWAKIGPDERVFLENGDNGATYTSDGIHPNEDGYDLTASMWKHFIYNYFEFPDTNPPTTTVDVDPGTYANSQEITLSCDDGEGIGCEAIYYTTDGTEPTTESNQYSSPISISANTTLKYFSVDMAGNQETFSGGNYIIDAEGPIRSGASPSASLDSGTTSANLALTTNENATCKYSATTGTEYDSMTIFSTTGDTSHSTPIADLQNNTSYAYYVKCRDATGNTNNADYQINFRVLSAADSIEKANLNFSNQSKQLTSKDQKLYLDKKNLKLKGNAIELAGGVVKIYADKDKLGQATVQSDGSWSEKVNFKKNKSYNLKIKYFDSSGTEIDSRNYYLEIDNEKPTFTEGFGAGKIISRAETINFPAQDQDTEVDYYKVKLLDSQGHITRKWRKQKDSFYKIPGDVPYGSYTLIVRAYDKAGNYVEQKTEIEFKESVSQKSSVLGVATEKESIAIEQEERIDEKEEEIATVTSPEEEELVNMEQPSPQEVDDAEEEKEDFKWWNPFSWF